MTFNLLPSKWLNKGHDVSVRRNDDQELPVYTLQNEVNRMFDDFFRSWDTPISASSLAMSPFRSLEHSGITPRVNLHETENELCISAELPGLNENEIDVSLSKDMIRISGEKKQETEENVKGWFRMERSYGSFSRSVALPCEVDQDQCRASFKNGVLTVTIAKTAQSKSATKCIPVKRE